MSEQATRKCLCTDTHWCREHRVKCADKHPLIGGGSCNGDHAQRLHHNDEGFFWGPIDEESAKR